MKLLTFIGIGLLAAIISSGLAAPIEAESFTVPYSIYGSKDGKQIDVFLGEVIVDENVYYELELVLMKATKDQTVTFHMSGYGGSVNNGLKLMSHIEASKAHTVMRVEAPLYSMHAVLVCAAKEVQMTTGGMLMFHDYSGVLDGKSNESLKNIKATSHLVKNVMTEYCVGKGILTKQEVSQIIDDGKDIYLHKEDLQKRLR